MGGARCSSETECTVTGSIKFDPDVQTQSHTVAASPKLDEVRIERVQPGFTRCSSAAARTVVKKKFWLEFFNDCASNFRRCG